MKLLLLLALLALPAAAAKKDLKWTRAVVESSFRQVQRGDIYVPYAPDSYIANTSVRQSIYIDAGEWLYHVTQTVHLNAVLSLPDGAVIEVAEEGKTLHLRVGGRIVKLHIEKRSRGK